MARSIKWIDVGIDADVHDGEMSRPAAAAARFDAESLATQLGYDPKKIQDEDALAMAQMLAERVNCAVSWADEPWVVTRLRADSARSITGPGTIDEDSWNYLVSQFEEICQLYGNVEARSGIGQAVERAMVGWFTSNAPATRPRQTRAGRS